MAFARMVGGSWVEVAGPFTIGAGDAAIQYPEGWLDGADADQLAAVGAAAIVEDAPPALPLQLAGQTLVDVGGVPHRRWIAPAAADLRQARRAELAAIRWAHQQTVKWNGRVAAADDTTTGRVVAAVFRAQVTNDTTATVLWKFGDGDFAQLTLADLTSYGTAIGANLQACYDREGELDAQIDAAADVAAIAAVDLTAGWPA